MMDNPPFIPSNEILPYLPRDYFMLPIEQRARALQEAGSAMAEDVFRRLGVDVDNRRKPSLNS